MAIENIKKGTKIFGKYKTGFMTVNLGSYQTKNLIGYKDHYLYFYLK